jgi:hypothetical protein
MQQFRVVGNCVVRFDRGNGVVAIDPRHGGSAEAADPRREGSAAATATLAMAGRSAGERRRSGTASGGRR